MTTDAILDRLDGVRRNGRGWEARCPAHKDQHASLSVSIGDDGRTLLHCHAGCHTDDIVDRLGLQMRDLFPEDNGLAKRNSRAKPVFVQSYDYTDEDGTILFQVRRTASKEFRQRRPDGHGSWIEGKGCMDGVRRVLYRLPELLANPHDIVYIPEGKGEFRP
ncbi:unnamed protein product, partial [marine sediment metagenome]